MFHVSSDHHPSSEHGENNTDNTDASLKSYESLINERWSYLGRDVFEFSEQTPYFINKTANSLELEDGATIETKETTNYFADFIGSIFSYLDPLIDLDFYDNINDQGSQIDIYEVASVSDWSDPEVGEIVGQARPQPGWFDLLWSSGDEHPIDFHKNTIVHEIGHALGLTHPDDDGWNAAWSTDDSVMSYNQGEEGWNYYFTELDIQALQHIWGVEDDELTPETTHQNSRPTGNVVIDGLPQVGQLLFADVSGLMDADGMGAVSYQWLSDGEEIAEATANTYQISNTEVGKQISVLISYVDLAGTYEEIESEKTEEINPLFEDLNQDGLIDGAKTYQLFNAGQTINLTRRGRTLSDASSRFWDIEMAVATETGFQVLLQGEGRRADRFQVWSANDAGVITGRSRWMRGHQMLEQGYEDLFNRDFNDDGFTGRPPAVDADGDGLIDGSGPYQLLKDGQAIPLTSRGKNLSAASSRFWDIEESVTTETGFQVLLQGEGRRDDRYQVWSANGAGVITDRSGWLKSDQMLEAGYEDLFGRDFNGDGITGRPPVVDDNGDGLIDGSSNYQFFKDGQAINLTRRGRTLSDASSRFWNVAQAVKNETGFEVLLQGEGRRSDRFLVWTSNDAGAITDRSRWLTADQMVEGGYEDLFGRDFNGDGTVATSTQLLV